MEKPIMNLEMFATIRNMEFLCLVMCVSSLKELLLEGGVTDYEMKVILKISLGASTSPYGSKNLLQASWSANRALELCNCPSIYLKCC